MVFSPIPLGRYSPDVVEGEGRCWRSIGECVWWPSAAKILDAHRKTKQSIVNIGKHYILKRFWCAAKNYTVSSADAADFARMMTAHSFAEVKASWCQASVIDVGDAGVEHFNWKRARFFFWVAGSVQCLFDVFFGACLSQTGFLCLSPLFLLWSVFKTWAYI